ncbi:hypothetical protein [Caulobacter sp. FWC2]|uniref:hypothetical protein n=1 Tax=Caulobacter sp. FWC2 TaxID=69664 RepID=UPI000C15992E|nr:hypothetical protein [Caulobacter sp. FWC2]PIB93791.1 hypothetical protein CSW62_20735 [Caulobacter sp. FWC2]
MTADRPRLSRLWIIAGLSVVLHVIVLAWLARPAAPARLDLAPDLALLSVELFRPATPAVLRQKPASRVPAPPAAAQATAPVSPEGVVSAVAPGPAVGGEATAPSPALMSENVRAALRSGAGCARRALSRQERDRCEEQFGRLTAATPTYDAPMDPGKRAYYDEVAAAGPSGRSSSDPTPGAVTPDHVYVPFLKCSVKFGVGRKPKDTQGTVRLGRSPCAIPLQGSVFTPEASVHKR